MADSRPPIHCAILHTPGLAVASECEFSDPTRCQRARGVLGGPFLLQDMSAMMITVVGILPEEVDAFAAGDPVVTAGLVRYEIRPWLTPFGKN